MDASPGKICGEVAAEAARLERRQLRTSSSGPKVAGAVRGEAVPELARQGEAGEPV